MDMSVPILEALVAASAIIILLAILGPWLQKR